MYHIDKIEIKQDEKVSQIGGHANIDKEYYPICPVTQKPMLLLMTLRKDIFDHGYSLKNFSVSGFICRRKGLVSITSCFLLALPFIFMNLLYLCQQWLQF